MMTIARLVVIAIACGATTVVLAAVPGDPMEPPQVWIAAQKSAGGPVTVEPPPDMKMILSGRTRKFAIIDGEIVKVGTEFKGSKVTAIRSDKVVMKDRAKTLAITPNVEKKRPVFVKAKRKLVVVPVGNVTSKAIRE